MTKDKFNSKLREYSKTLSPNDKERDLVGKIYQSFNDLFGVNNCIQIGSYPRFTAITGFHDLDILYILGSWDENNHTPTQILKKLNDQINVDYVNPTDYTRKVSLQTHSVTVEFYQNSELILSVDIVPAYSYAKNEYNQDVYKVPEVIKEKDHIKRNALIWDATNSHSWINSDPRGYIEVSKNINQNNNDFRKTVKSIKVWKNNLEEATKGKVKFKSFHIEQVITKFFQGNREIEIFDAVFRFFIELPNIINNPNQITDRANADKFIDDYIADLIPEQKEKIIWARDGFLINLENIKENGNVADLFTDISFYKRSSSEQFLFDENIPILKEETIGIVCKDTLTQRILGALGFANHNTKLSFKEFMPPKDTWFKWKVKNDNRCQEPRGEITDHSTKNPIETVSYIGDHYVECFAIRNGVCVASAMQNVRYRK